jgi:regulatory protein
MRIESIEIVKQKNRRTVHYQIRSDDGREKIIQADTIVYFNLHTGDELSEEQWSSIVLYDEEKIIIQTSLDLISRRLRSEKELRDRFRQKGFSDPAIVNAISHLRNNGYLNDIHFALLFAKQLIKKKPVGEIKIRFELKNKGIAEAEIERILDELSEQQNDMALHAARKKKNTIKNDDPNVIRQKLWRFLQQRGFSGEVISRTINKILNE